MTPHELFAYLIVRNAPEALAFYSKVFGAKERLRLTEPSGRVGHAELLLGPHTLMVSEEFPEYGIRGPQSLGGTSVTIHLHVDDADAVIARMVEHGATVLIAARDQFYGERSGRVRDPFGHEWNIGHHLEDLSPEEMQRRYTALFSEAK